MTEQVARNWRNWSAQFEMQQRAYSKVIDTDLTRLTAFFHFALLNLCSKVSDDEFADAVQQAVESALEGSPAAAGNAEPVVAEQQSLRGDSAETPSDTNQSSPRRSSVSTQPHPQEIISARNVSEAAISKAETGQ